MKKLFMTRSRAVAYLLNTRRAMPEEIGGLRVIDAESQIHTLEAAERLILDVRSGRKSQFSVIFPEEIAVFITDP
jgi:hypothetical protein